MATYVSISATTSGTTSTTFELINLNDIDWACTLQAGKNNTTTMRIRDPDGVAQVTQSQAGGSIGATNSYNGSYTPAQIGTWSIEIEQEDTSSSSAEAYFNLYDWTETTYNTGLSENDIFYEDLAGLDAETDYEFQVQVKNRDNTSGWTASRDFTTLAAFPTQYAGLRIGNGGVADELCLVAEGDGNTGMGGIPKIVKGGTIYDIYLVETSDANASSVRVRTSTGIKAIRNKT